MEKVNVKVVKANSPSDTTKAIYSDPFENSYGDSEIIPPPYNLKELKLMGEYSTILQQCIEAYKINLFGFGFQPKYRFDYNSKDTKNETRLAADKEWIRLEEFIRYANYDDECEDILAYAIEDREKMGNGYVEVLRDSLNRPCGIEYMDGQFIRITKKTVPEEVSQIVFEDKKKKEIKRWRTFRKFVQIINGKKRYFKEYGDPRIMNLLTGKYDESTPEHLRATEVIHFKLGSGVYGTPRWIGHVVGLYGARKAEELNLLYFKQGRHVPAAVIVENGMLTENSYTQLQEYMNGVEGVDNSHKFLLLEVEGIETGSPASKDGEKPTAVKVQIKSLAEILQEDALFLEYDKKVRDKLRSAFRLPPLYTGESQEYNKATADTARTITEEQVFRPERKRISGKLNTLFLHELGLEHVELMLKGPDLSDPLEISKALDPFISGGAATPNDLRDLLGNILGKTLDELPEEYNVPLQMITNRLSHQSEIPLLKSQSIDFITILKDLRDLIEERIA